MTTETPPPAWVSPKGVYMDHLVELKARMVTATENAVGAVKAENMITALDTLIAAVNASLSEVDEMVEVTDRMTVVVELASQMFNQPLEETATSFQAMVQALKSKQPGQGPSTDP